MRSELSGKSDTLKEIIDNSQAPGQVRDGLPIGAATFTVLLVALFGANAVAIKISLAGIGVFTAAGVRFFIAAVTIFLYAALTKKPLRLKTGQYPQMVFLGLVFFVQLALFYNGQKLTTASHGTLIANVLPFVIMVLAHYYIPGEKIVLKKVSGLVLGFGGVVLLFLDSLSMTVEMLHGDLIVLAAILIWSVNGIYTKKIISAYHPVQITCYPMILASIGFIICGFLFDDPMVSYVDWSIIKAMLYQTFVTASFGMVAWNTLIRRYGATTLHSFVFIMPISGVVCGVLMLGEPVTAKLLGSVLLVVCGLFIVNRQ